ncbi:hypothetical protein [Streptomyces bacillaris]|uniref:hypothetical protein n=1 Tax=Streptomyces bacillaris TaxID=68179 RepID=UPI00345F416A
MALASMGKLEELADEPAEDGPICVAEITSLTDVVLTFRLGTTTREQMDYYLPRLARELNSLLDVDLGAQEDREVQEIVRQARKLIELPNRPDSKTPTFGAFFYLRDVANLCRRLLWIHVSRNDLEAP